MFNFRDNVDCDKLERAGDSQLSTKRRQLGNESVDKVESRQLCLLSTLSVVSTLSVASVYWPLVISPEMTSKTGQVSVDPSGLIIFRTLRL